MSLTVARSVRSDDVAERRQRLRKAVSARFLELVIEPDPDGVYTNPPCRVPNCGRISRNHDVVLCGIHKGNWYASGQSDLDTWLVDATTHPLLAPLKVELRRPVTGKDACVVPGCAEDKTSNGLCMGHTRRAKRDAHSEKIEVRSDHIAKWFISAREERFLSSRGAIDLRPLNEDLRMEIAYGIQGRGSDVARGRVRPSQLNPVVAALGRSGLTSLLPWGSNPDEFIDGLGLTIDAAKQGKSFIRQTAALLTDLYDLDGRRTLGNRSTGSPYFMDLSRLRVGWLKPLVARWVKYRLDSEASSPQYLGQQLKALKNFDAYLWEQGVIDPAMLNRDVMLGYLAAVKQSRKADGSKWSVVAQRRWLGVPNQFLDEVRQLEWEPQLRSSARFLKGELPRQVESKPRFISEFVMAQLESERALNEIRRPDMRTAIEIIMSVGMRMGHTLQLRYQCLVELPRQSGPPAFAVEFWDSKARKWQLLPIADTVVESIRRQQQRVKAEHPDAILLFARTGPGADWTRSTVPQTLHTALKQWCDAVELHDENGERVHVTAHQFRHTCATRWINADVPQAVVQKLLGHTSPGQVAVYARLHDSTVREQWERIQRVNVRGETIGLPHDDHIDTEWMLEQLSRATQALSNGYCALPLQKSCPHANACLTCDSFTTSVEFLPILIGQLGNHREMIATAEASGHQRLAEINRVPALNLERIIAGLEALPQDVP